MAHELFPEWLSKAETALDHETCLRRIQGVDSLAASATEKTALTLVRLVLGKPVAPADQRPIRSRFVRYDSLFKTRNNDYEMRIMAGATLVQMMEVVASEAALVAAMALDCNLQFMIEPPCIPELGQIVEGYLRHQAATVRELQEVLPADSAAEATLASVKHLARSLDTATGSLRKQTFADAFDAMSAFIMRTQENYAKTIRNQHIIAEEANMLWWVFGQRLMDPLPDVASFPGCIAMLAGQELAGMTRLLPGPLSIPAVLSRFNQAAGVDLLEPIELAQTVNRFPRTWRKAWITDFEASPALDLCPFLLAVQKSLTTDGEQDWLPVYRTALGFNFPQITAQALSERTYRECLLARSAMVCSGGHQ